MLLGSVREGMGLQWAQEWALGETGTQVMRKETPRPYKPCLQDSACRTPEVFLLGSDHLS